ncbi:hypothetical protein JOF29_007079 [Kribbella aluminosa]|uniref:Uncharacterized protein n=1 Tax=Kribbella aluminosa TaxID=416017 RepID=A0ABS4UWD9_9ACTN|nr:hypothetical protein [Kribbella aluminosa]
MIGFLRLRVTPPFRRLWNHDAASAHRSGGSDCARQGIAKAVDLPLPLPGWRDVFVPLSVASCVQGLALTFRGLPSLHTNCVSGVAQGG